MSKEYFKCDCCGKYYLAEEFEELEDWSYICDHCYNDDSGVEGEPS